MESKDNGPGIWPGFVAATVCLLQGLLLLIGVLALAIAVIAMAPRITEKDNDPDHIHNGDFSIAVKATENSIELQDTKDKKQVVKMLELEQLNVARVQNCTLLARPLSGLSLDLKKAYIRNIYVKNLLTALGIDPKKIEMNINTEPSSIALKIDCFY